MPSKSIREDKVRIDRLLKALVSVLLCALLLPSSTSYADDPLATFEELMLKAQTAN